MKHHTMIWLGTEDGFSIYADKIQIRDTAIESGQAQAFMGLDDGESGSESEREFGDMDYMMQRVDGTAVISINGPMDNDYSYMNRYFGMVSYQEIRSAVTEAVNHPEVTAILLDIDSPGGAVSGLSEVSDFIKGVDSEHLPVYTNSSAMMTSGGYWLGSNGREVMASELATVGSIGVIAVHREMSEMMKKAGINATVIREGKYKALANPYEKLTAVAREEIQKELGTIYDVFTRTVAENRGQTQQFIKDNAAEGRTFLGREAREVGLVDTLGTFDDALAMIKRKVEVNTGQQSNQLEVSDMSRKRKVISKADQAVLAAGGEITPAAEDTSTTDEGVATDVLDGSDAAGADAGDGDAAGAAAAAGSSDGTDEATDAGADAAADAASGDAAAPTAADATAVALVAQLAAVQDQIVDLKVQVKGFEAAQAAQEASVAVLRPIVVSAMQRLQVATGGVATDFDAVEIPALVAQYDSLNTAFLERFPVGASSEVPTQSDASEDSAEVTHMDVARSNATRINQSK